MVWFVRVVRIDTEGYVTEPINVKDVIYFDFTSPISVVCLKDKWLCKSVEPPEKVRFLHEYQNYYQLITGKELSTKGIK